MEKPSTLISHIEAFVDSARVLNQHAKSVDAISSLIKNDLLTLEALVREMELYLTSTDHIIRGRGTLLLAEVLNCLLEKPLDSHTISILVEFFTAKLEDWQVLWGVLVGCLALLKRTKKFGMVDNSDARTLAKSFLINVQVQSLAVRDRKLCLEVLQCLLDAYTDAVVVLGDDLVYGICEAIDEEKDPRCLMLNFHLVEILGHLYPDPSGPMASFAQDIFDILSRYYPIYFTHPKDDGLDIKREDLSKGLMNAFSSSPFFEPFVVPLLLEKLSSSLLSAKLDSLKYLNSCLYHYGGKRMVKHSRVIWSNLKDVIFNFSPERPLLTDELDVDMKSEVNQIRMEALNCLETALSCFDFSEQDSFLCLIIDDPDIGTKLESLTSITSYSGTSAEIQRDLSAIGGIFTSIAKVSIYCCNKVFLKFFPCLMDVLGVSRNHSSQFCITNHKTVHGGMNFGALFLSVELLSSSRELSLVSNIAAEFIAESKSWFFMLKSFSMDLCHVLGSVLRTSNTSMVASEKEGVLCAVKGLQSLSTFPSSCSPISEGCYEDVLEILMSIITGRSDETYLWNLSLKALVQIGLWIESASGHDSARGICYNKVVEKILSMLQTNDSMVSLSLKLVAISEIANVGQYVLSIIRALEDAIISSLVACIQGGLKSSDSLVGLLECYTSRVLPRCCTSGSFDDVAVQFSINIWNQLENVSVFNTDVTMQVLDQVMITMKLLVAGCTVENQSLILKKAHCVILSMDFLKTQPFQSIHGIIALSCRDKWIASLFGSVVIALRSQTPLTDMKGILNLFLILLPEGNLPAAQALASMVNKCPSSINEPEISARLSLDQACEDILKLCLWTLESNSHLKQYNFLDRDICSQRSIVLGMAWVGKGLLMRGHEKVTEIAMFLMKCLVSDSNEDITLQQQKENGKGVGMDANSSLATSAADAFHVLLNDSEDCLNKKFHATIRPLYKQRFFSSMLPILLSSIKESGSTSKKIALYRALGHIISDTPLAAVLAESKKIIPALLDTLAISGSETSHKKIVYSLLLVLSGILMDDNGKVTILENIHTVIECLIKLISYPDLMIVRETAIQCLVAMSVLPHARIFPFRPRVLKAVATALDDRKRAVRQEAVRCRQAWASIASRSLQF
ncbi:MMS19 nucleotide excision repair protein homolog isoform X2 [Zingiber officinale]|uniref:MMS19 nucleotide excision repair protein homolog isoform X2 n=1 Tax=Zingiber officinale TaxID=94328 RepID=UPI001C4D100A|nr:MMS19 nucleotide excision repair protein homolog isoform X2 [Zingiber officinale]